MELHYHTMQKNVIHLTLKEISQITYTTVDVLYSSIAALFDVRIMYVLCTHMLV